MSVTKLHVQNLFRGPLLLACISLFAGWLCAQTSNANLNGTVTDPSGASIAGAELTLTNAATGFSAKFTSDDRGEYSFRNLTPGTYELTVSKSGFQGYDQKDLVITLNQTARQDVTLKVGSQTETISVTAGSSQINFENATVQGGIDPNTLKSLPLVVEGKLRSSAGLVTLLPGVTTGNSAQPFAARINGGVETGDEALLDGASMQEGFMSQSGMVSIHQDFSLSPDMVQEVKLVASNYDAQYGSSTSGQVVVVTKSGGNKYHGAGFEYARNTALNAAPWNAPPCATPNPGCDRRPVDIENDFGANFGGPVPLINRGNHKTFFYFNFESYRLAGGSSVPTISIPSLKERAGDFTDWAFPIYSPDNFGAILGSDPAATSGPASAACQNALPVGFGGGQAFPGNIIPSACISPIVSAYLSFLPNPTAPGATNNYTLSRPVPDTLTANSNYYMFRIDHNWGDKDHFYFSYWRQYTSPNLATTLPRQIANDRFTPLQNSPITRFNWERVISPTMTNHVTLGYLNRNEGDSTLNLDQIGTLPGVPGAAGNNTLPAFQFDSDGFQNISSNAANKTTRPTWVLNDLATKVLRHHTLTFGAEWRNVGGNIHFLEEQAGTYHFDRKTTSLAGNGATGSPIAGFLLGAPSIGEVSFRSVPFYYPRQKVYALHANDSWKVTSKFTFNYGLRWDYYSPSREKENHLSFIDPVGPNPDAGGRPGRLAFAGNGNGPASFGKDFPEKPWHNGFAPRLGAAYALDQKTVVRAGYGIFFAQAFYPGWHGGMILDGFNLKDALGTGGANGITPPFYMDIGFPSPASTLGCTLGTSCINPGFDNGRFPITGNGNGSGYRPFDANRRPYSQQWNLTIERELPKNIALSVAYVGNKGTRLTSTLEPINVLNPFDAQIRVLEAPSNPACGNASPNPSQPVPCVPLLNDVFTADGQTIDGVTTPYNGWVSQLNATGACTPNVAQALLPYPQFCGPLQGMNENHGNSIYHSFQLKAEREFRNSLYMLVSYTNSKLISDASDNTQQLGGTWNGTQGVISPFEKQRARSLSSDDVPQVLSATFVYELPFGKGKRYVSNGFASKLAGGWQFAPLFHYSRGTPMWFRSGNCPVQSQVPQLRQNCLVGLVPSVSPFLQDPNTFDPRKGGLLNPVAFEAVSDFNFNPGGTPGAAGGFGFTGFGPRITNLRGPNFKNIDFSLTKNTYLTERVNFQLRFAFFNAFNLHYFINNGVNNQGSSFAFINDVASGGRPFGFWDGSNVSPPRTIQIGGRLEF
jgi:hypothetical protein